HFHFPETLSTKLRLSAQRLLGDKRVRTDGARVHLVVDKVTELQHVGNAYGYRLIESLSGESVKEVRAAECRQPCLFQFLRHLLCGGAIEDRSSIGASQFQSGPAQYCFEDLSQVHPRGYTQRVETNIDGGSVLKERHVLFADDPCHNAFVSVTASHLIANLQFTFLGYIYFGKLNDAGRELVAHFQGKAFAFEFTCVAIALHEKVLHHLRHQVVCVVVGSPVVKRDVGNQVDFLRNVIVTFVAVNVLVREQVAFDHLCGKLHAFADQLIPKLVAYATAGLTIQKGRELFDQLIPVFSKLLAVSCFKGIELFLGLRANIFVAFGPREKFRIDHDTLQ